MQIHADKRCRKHVHCDSGNLDISQSQMNMSANTAGQTIGLFKEEIQKAGRCYITGSRDCLRAAQQTRIAFVVVVILLLQSPSVCEPPATLRVRHKEVGRTTYWFTLFCHCCALIRLIYSWTHVHICCLSPALSSPKQYVAHSWSFAEHLQDLRSRFNLKHY